MHLNELTAETLREWPLPTPKKADKTARGTVVVVGGSAAIPGAASLAGVAALRAGAGCLRIATCRSNASALAIAVPEASVFGLAETGDGGIDPSAIDKLLPLIESADGVLIGPGMTDQKAIDALTFAILERAVPGTQFVFDARAIKSLREAGPSFERHAPQAVFTPHAGEMAGLLDRERNDIEADPDRFAREAADALRSTVALKGARTFIASADAHSAWCRGNAGLATAGTGDVLAGLIVGFIARGAEPFAATCWGVYVHARAGDRLAETVGPVGFLAREILPEIPRIMRDVQEATKV